MSEIKIAIVGTGFSGIGIAMRLKQAGFENFVMLEKANDIGGTWRENTYPGAACDVKSHLYSFSFAPKNDWSRVFSAQKEIQQYLKDCVADAKLEKHIHLGWEMKSAIFNDSEKNWQLTNQNGEEITASHFILATGPLHIPSIPQLKGLENFEGEKFHSAKWNHAYKLEGKNVAVIGTGASAIQFVPEIQAQVSRLFLFQRTAPWVIPKPDGKISEWRKKIFSLFPFTREFYRNSIYWINEVQVLGFTTRRGLLRAAEKLVKWNLKRHIKDEELLKKITPDYAMGCKRILLSNNYYRALQKENVEVITDSISSIGKNFVETVNGKKIEVDALIFGTGFHVTDSFNFADISGTNGLKLRDAWRSGAEAYLGTLVNGFPNLFIMIGPNTGLGHNSMVYMIEAQANLIVDCIQKMQGENLNTIEVKRDVQENFNRAIDKQAEGTVWNSGCNSWYLNEQGRSAAVWPDFTFKFKAATQKVNGADYEWS